MRKKARGKLSGDFPHALKGPVQGVNDCPTGQVTFLYNEKREQDCYEENYLIGVKP